jgi:branched-chain amino acid aminotransferase
MSEACRAGFDEAIQLNLEGYVAEGAGENLFLVRDGVVLTPPDSAGILMGITRATVIELLRDLNIEVREQPLFRSDLYTADELFFCGTGAEITPIREVDNRPIASGTGPGPVTKLVRDTYFDTVGGKLPKYEHWLDYAYPDGSASTPSA